MEQAGSTGWKHCQDSDDPEAFAAFRDPLNDDAKYTTRALEM
jgi:hypothetical protein